MGGLGCPVAEFLTRSGVGSGIVDNFVNQQIYIDKVYMTKKI